MVENAPPEQTRSKPRRVPMRVKLVFSVIMMVLATVAAEIAVRLFVPVRSVGPVGTTYDPVYGKALKKSYSCRRTGAEFTYTLSTNSLGFRGPEPKSLPKGAVVFLGDSFTMGSAVDDGEEVPALIAGKLDERYGRDVVPVVNAGVANNGNGRWVKFLRGEAERYDPSFVVMQVYINDFADNANERLFELDADGKLVERPVPKPGKAQRLQAIVESIPLVRYSYLVAIARQAVSNVMAKQQVMWDKTDPVTVDPLTYAILDEALRVSVTEHKWPTGIEIIECRPDQEARVREIAARYGVPVLRLPGKKERPDLYWKIDPHWHAQGSVWVADEVYKAFLADRDLTLRTAATAPSASE